MASGEISGVSYGAFAGSPNASRCAGCFLYHFYWLQALSWALTCGVPHSHQDAPALPSVFSSCMRQR